MFEQSIREISRLLRQAKYTVALTGAGVSTPSGIPDFRSPDAGLWSQVNPFEVASLQGFRYKPEAFYQWMRPLAHRILHADPNPAHFALAQLEEMGILKSVITQNIDMLHSKAGSTYVYEVHGHVREATCISCFTVYPAEPVLRKYLDDCERCVPRCPKCNGVLKPNVVLMGEQLPVQVLMKAEREARLADLMLVAGSSMEVVPVADLPNRVLQNGGRLAIINLTDTVYDSAAEVVIHDDVADVLPRIVSLLGRENHD